MKITDTEFRYHVECMRGNMQAPSTRAAYMVLVEGTSQKAAYEICGSSASNVSDAVRRIKQRHARMMEVFIARAKLTRDALLAIGVKPEDLIAVLPELENAENESA